MVGLSALTVHWLDGTRVRQYCQYPHLLPVDHLAIHRFDSRSRLWLSERRAREDYGHQISNQMCCDTEWVLGAVGLGSCAILVLWGSPSVFGAPAGSFGRCCCCCCGGVDSARAVGVLLSITAAGLLTLSVIQMCWFVVGHGFGAAFFFGSGGVLILLLNATTLYCCKSDTVLDVDASTAAQTDKGVLVLDVDASNAAQAGKGVLVLDVDASTAAQAAQADKGVLDPPTRALPAEGIPVRVIRLASFGIGIFGMIVFVVDEYVGEWLIVFAIALIVLYLQMRLLEVQNDDSASLLDGVAHDIDEMEQSVHTKDEEL